MNSANLYCSIVFDRPTYQIYCNSNTPHAPVYSLFVADFNDCIDACAHWSFYAPLAFENNGTSAAVNQTCAGLSFVPLWTDRTKAVEGTAPGNCYLKPGPTIERKDLMDPNAGTAVHSALLVSNE